MQQRYDGDTEQSRRKTNVRATVDGNARRQSRRYSSDESAAQESSADVETYLDQYKNSTPIRPGESMYRIIPKNTSKINQNRNIHYKNGVCWIILCLAIIVGLQYLALILSALDYSVSN